MSNEQPATEIDSLFQLAGTHSWMAFAAALAWIMVRVAKDDRAVKWFPIEIAPRWRAWGAAFIGLAYGILHKLAAGGSWGEAIVGGFAAGNSATLAHELLIESLRKGRDLGVAKEDAPPPPPPRPPLSIKPPGGSLKPPPVVTSTLLLLLLVACGGLAPAIADDGLPLMSAGACKEKGMRISRGPGSCPDKRARLEQLVRYDADCVGLYADAGPVLRCREDDAADAWETGGANR